VTASQAPTAKLPFVSGPITPRMNGRESAPRTYADSHIAIAQEKLDFGIDGGGADPGESRVTITSKVSTAAWTSWATRARLGCRRREPR
jgi:hypothetical protein